MSNLEKKEDTGGGDERGKGESQEGGEGGTEKVQAENPSSNAPSYSDKLKVNVKKAERFKRNVLEITLENDPGIKISIDPQTTANLMSKLGIEKTQCTGVQPCPGFSCRL